MNKRKYTKAQLDGWQHHAPHPATSFQGRRDSDPDTGIDLPSPEPEHKWDESLAMTDAKHPAIGLLFYPEADRVSAWFGFRLQSVVSEKSLASGRAIDPNLSGLSALSVMLASLLPDERLYVVMTCDGNSQQGFHFRYEIHGQTIARSRNDAVAQAQMLVENMNVAFAFMKSSHSFISLSQPPTKWHDLSLQRYRYRLDPVSLCISEIPKASLGFTGSNLIASEPSQLRLPLPDKPSFPFSVEIVPALLASEQVLAMVIELESLTLTQRGVDQLSAGLVALSQLSPMAKQITLDQDAPGELTGETRKILAIQLECWLHRSKGFTCNCFAFSESPIPSSVLAISGCNLFGGRSVNITESPKVAWGIRPSFIRNREAKPDNGCNGAALDLSRAYHATQLPPALLPRPEALLQLGFMQHYDMPPIQLASHGIVLGETQNRQVVRFAEEGRTRHCYVMGATGTGKSTLLYNMIVQDMVAGRGVGLFDPHGDLYRQVLEAVPARRIKDVVLIDPADAEYSVGVNFLEIDNLDPVREKAFVTNELIKIIQRLFLAEHIGPAFEGMMRNAVGLLLASPEDRFTLVDIPKVFTDAQFRNSLLAKCRDPIVFQFWGNAVKLTGENNLTNFTYYIVNKLGPFIYNPAVRRIIGQERSTIDFRGAIDDGKILLINLPKGEIGGLDTSFLGMLFMGKILGAALSRAKLPKNKRRPFHLYVDEFQNFTTDSVATLLAEARKYGLYLTFANQNMAQLPEVLLETVMGNVGTRLFMRSGINDAPIIEPSLAPYLNTQDLMNLPDYHVAGRMLMNNIPSKPLVFRTQPPIPAACKGIALQAHLEKIRARSRAHHAKPVGEVDKLIGKRFI